MSTPRSGYRTCAAPGCVSKVTEGKIFRRFPAKEPLLSLWLEQLPKDFKVSSSTAFCEDHFEKCQFEAPRSDGKKRLKLSAVPRMSLLCSLEVGDFVVLKSRKVLGDVTNKEEIRPKRIDELPLDDHCYYQSPRKSHSSKQCNSETISYRHSQEVDAVDALLGLAQQELDIIFNPIAEGCNSTFIIPDNSHCDNSVTSLSDSGVERDVCSVIEVPHSPEALKVDSASIECTNLVLDESTGIFRILDDDSHVSNPEIQMLNGAIPNDEGWLDEATGTFTPSASCGELPSQINDTEPNVDDFLLNGNLTKEDVLAFVIKQQEALDRLNQIIEEKDVRLTELTKAVLYRGKFETKYIAIKSSMHRLQQKFKRCTYSPYLSESQLERLSRKSNRGKKWDPEDIRHGLILKMKCGTSGYQAFVTKFPFLPSVRTLQRSVQFIRFDSGLLHEIFDLAEGFSKGMTDMEKDCQVVMDELQMDSHPKYDKSLSKWVGYCTLAGHSGPASKALIVLLAGISRRWKIAVAIEFTNKKDKGDKENTTGKAYSDLITSVVIKAEAAGLRVNGVTTDMGPDNLAFWKVFGVTGSRSDELVTSIPNPARPGAKLFIAPDWVHLFKRIKSMLESNTILFLPFNIIKEEGLESNMVDYRHIDDVLEFESDSELKIAFRLKKENVHCKNQFQTMSVGTAKAVISQRTGVALKVQAKEREDRSYETTGWFVMFLNAFFALATCRHRGLAISKHNPHAYEKAIKMIEKMSYIFSNMKIGKDGEWKPVQRGVKVLCASLLGIIHYFIEIRGYPYLMLGRFTSDCIENLISLLRMRQPLPDASMVLQCVKVITLAQFSEAVRGSSYDFEESETLPSSDFLEEARKRAKERAEVRHGESLEELMNNPIEKVTEKDFTILNGFEKSVVYDMAGSTLASILKSNMSVCKTCVDALKWKGLSKHPASFITEMKEFTMLKCDNSSKNTRQIYVSDVVYKAILSAEVTYRMYRERSSKFDNVNVREYFVENLMYVWNTSEIPQCHNICRKMLTFFFQ